MLSFKKIFIAAIVILAVLVTTHFFFFLNYPARCTVTLNKSTIPAGDKVIYAVNVTSKSGFAVNIPDVKDQLSQFRIIDSGFSKEEFMGRSYARRWYLLMQFKPGEYTLGPAGGTVESPDGEAVNLKSETVALTVKSVLGSEPAVAAAVTIENEILGRRGTFTKETRERAVRQVKTPVEIKIINTRGPVEIFNYFDIVLFGAEAALCFFIFSWLFLFFRKKISERMRITPYEAAQSDFTSLRAAIRNGKISPQECCVKLPVIIKRYVKGAFRAGSLELTTAEYLQELQALAGYTEPLNKKMTDFLSYCDLIKFAGREPSGENIDTLIADAGDIFSAFYALEMASRETVKS